MKKMLSSIKATLADDIDSSLVKSSKLAIFTLLESFFSLHEKKKSFNETSWEKKNAICLSVSEKNELFTFWKYLNLTWWTIWNLKINKGRKDWY